MNGTTTPPVFTRLNRSQVHLLLEWAALEGWNPGLHDADLFYDADPEGFYGFFDGNDLIAGGALVSYGSAFGFMGLFIVKPEYRGTGIGRELWYLRRDLLLNRLSPGAPIGMDGVVSMQAFYSKGGFQLAFKDERYEITGATLERHPYVMPLQASDINPLLKMDLLCFGYDRSGFLQAWLKQSGTKVFQYGTGDAFNGFAVMRKALSGWKIGPLFAASATAANALLEACMDAVPGDKLYLDTPGSNPAARELALRHGGQFVFECGRMYLGNAPALPMELIYGITSFELG
jgi:GNAT superfamily N-acetyltransferase